MRYKILILIALALMLLPLAAQDRNYAPPNTIMDYVSPQMRSAGFWIQRHPSPDKVIMSPDEVKAFNASIRRRRGSVAVMENMGPGIGGSTVRNSINNALKVVTGMTLWDTSGNKIPSSFWTPIRANCNLGAIPKNVRMRYGFPVRFASQRLAPTSVNLNKKRLDIEFDEVQNSGYDIGTPHVFYHTSADGAWVFGSSAVTTGWYKVEDICFVDQQTYKDFQNGDFVVVTTSRADLWTNPEATQTPGYLRMGAKLPLIEDLGDYWKVKVPVWDAAGPRIAEGLIAKSDANRGYLPYTARNVYTLAFRMLDKPYGWADMNGDTDCSSFVRNLFSCFGIILPRNSAEQEKSGSIAYTYTKGESVASRTEKLIQKGIPGITILRRPGHVTLYLGHDKGHAYVIHNTWAFRKMNDSKKDEPFVVHRVIVSDVLYGENASFGPLMKAITAISVLK